MGTKMNPCNYFPITDCLVMSNTKRGNGTLLVSVNLVGEWAARHAISFGLFHSGLMNVNAWSWKYESLFGHLLCVCFSPSYTEANCIHMLTL